VTIRGFSNIISLPQASNLLFCFFGNQCRIMQADTLIKLLEELIEIKIRQHSATIMGNATGVNPELVRVLAMTKMADRDKIIQVRSQLVQLLETGTDAAA
jgi:hypothetical protein